MDIGTIHGAIADDPLNLVRAPGRMDQRLLDQPQTARPFPDADNHMTALGKCARRSGYSALRREPGSAPGRIWKPASPTGARLAEHGP